MNLALCSPTWRLRKRRPHVYYVKTGDQLGQRVNAGLTSHVGQTTSCHMFDPIISQYILLTLLANIYIIYIYSCYLLYIYIDNIPIVNSGWLGLPTIYHVQTMRQHELCWFSAKRFFQSYYITDVIA